MEIVRDWRGPPATLKGAAVAIGAFDGTVIAVTHDRWFARTFTRFLVFGVDGKVKESVEPQWV